VTKNGNAYKSGSGAHWQFTPDDEGTSRHDESRDDGSQFDTASVTVTGTNVWPTATITGVNASAP